MAGKRERYVSATRQRTQWPVPCAGLGTKPTIGAAPCPQNSCPRIYDPPEGYVTSANEDIRGIDGACLITLPVPDYRKRRIDERLAALPQATLEDMQALQYDVVSLQARDLLSLFLPELAEGEVKTRLADWNFSYDPASTAATLFSQFYRNVLLEVFGRDTGQQRGSVGGECSISARALALPCPLSPASIDAAQDRESLVAGTRQGDN